MDLIFWFFSSKYMPEIQQYLHENPAVADRLADVFGESSRGKIKSKFHILVGDYHELIDFFYNEEDPYLTSFQDSDFNSQMYLDFGVVEVEDFEVRLNYEALYYVDIFYRKFLMGQDQDLEEVETDGDVSFEEFLDLEELNETLEQRDQNVDRVFNEEDSGRELDKDDFDSGGGPEWFG